MCVHACVYPVRLCLAQRGGGVDVHRLLLHHSFVALLGVLTCSVEEEATGDGLQGSVRICVQSYKSQGNGNRQSTCTICCIALSEAHSSSRCLCEWPALCERPVRASAGVSGLLCVRPVRASAGVSSNCQCMSGICMHGCAENSNGANGASNWTFWPHHKRSGLEV